MNSFERWMNRIQGKAVDRASNMNIVMQFAARDAGLCCGQVARDGRRLADGIPQEACIFSVLQLGKLAKVGPEEAFTSAHPEIAWKQLLKAPDIKKRTREWMRSLLLFIYKRRFS